ncbi:hypothetical protein KAU33_01995, partial [Candidatus Dependentiae bacterium]|nr:hypothetical protein [Candidatus Dependentiae bacterium]
TIIPKNKYSYTITFLSTRLIKYDRTRYKDSITIKDEFQGTGPFKIKEYNDAYIILEKNKNYFKGEPKVDYIKIIFFNSYYEQFSALMSGDIDLIFMADYSQVKWLKGNKDFNVIEKFFPFYITLLFNFKANHPLNLKQRQFLSALFSQEELKYKFKEFYNKPAIGPLYPDSEVYKKYFQYNVKVQEQIHIPIKDFPELNILYLEDIPILRKAAFYIQDKFIRQGIPVKFTPKKLIELDLSKLSDYNLFLTTFRAPNNLSYNYLKYGKEGVYNYTGYNNQKAEDIIIRSYTEFDKAKIFKLEEDFYLEIMKDYPEIFLFYPKEIFIISNKVKLNSEPDIFLFNSHLWEKSK